MAVATMDPGAPWGRSEPRRQGEERVEIRCRCACSASLAVAEVEERLPADEPPGRPRAAPEVAGSGAARAVEDRPKKGLPLSPARLARYEGRTIEWPKRKRGTLELDRDDAWALGAGRSGGRGGAGVDEGTADDLGQDSSPPSTGSARPRAAHRVEDRRCGVGRSLAAVGHGVVEPGRRCAARENQVLVVAGVADDGGAVALAGRSSNWPPDSTRNWTGRPGVELRARARGRRRTPSRGRAGDCAGSALRATFTGWPRAEPRRTGDVVVEELAHEGGAGGLGGVVAVVRAERRAR